MIKTILMVMALATSIQICGQSPQDIKAKGLTGKLIRYESFPSTNVAPRNVDVWLPLDFDKKKKYSVLYMHDGQNLFIPELSYTKIDWGVDETVTKLSKDGEIRPTIVVGVWNTSRRVEEYMPQKSLQYASKEQAAKAPKGFEVISDKYLKFLVEELKPFIDKNYPTRKDRKNTSIMGSSMGGLISCYAVSEYPKVFGSAGCVSTHFPAGEGITLKYFENGIPKAGKHRIYFDFGTVGLDAQYEPYQVQMDAIMEKKGYTSGKDWTTKKFEGADHSEKAWRARLDIPIKFLLSKR